MADFDVSKLGKGIVSAGGELVHWVTKPKCRVKNIASVDFVRAIVVASGGFVGIAAAFGSVELLAQTPLISLRTVWIWLVFGSFAFCAAKLMKGKGTFGKTLWVMLNVMQVSYITGVGAAMLASVVTYPFASDETAFIVVAGTLLLGQFTMAAWILPSRVGALHRLTGFRRTALLLIPALMLTTNVTLSAWPAYKEGKKEMSATIDSHLAKAQLAKFKPIVPICGPLKEIKL